MIERIIRRRRKDLGGLEVGRVLPAPQRRMVGPFIFFDHMGPADFAPGLPREVDVRPHPHIGLSTLTYLFDGEIMHRDSVGSQQPIRPGEVNWMTAGSGITHSERFERARREGGRLDGIQLWIALPQADEETEPAFTHHPSAELPQWDDGGVRGRLIAGEAFGMRAPVRTHSPLAYVHWEMAPGARLSVPPLLNERAIYVARGEVELAGQRVAEGEMAVLTPAHAADLFATRETTVMLIAGEPVGERFIEWNFVSSSKERIEQAKADWAAGRMKLPYLDEEEWIPLPTAPKEPEPMS